MATDPSQGLVIRRIIDWAPWATLLIAGMVSFWAWAQTSLFGPSWGVLGTTPGLEYPTGLRQVISQRTLIAAVLIVLGTALPWLVGRVASAAGRESSIAQPGNRSKRSGLLVGGAQVALAVIAGSLALVSATSARDVLQPHAAEVQMIYDFEPPAGWKVDRDRTILTYSVESDSSYFPGVSRSWYISGSVAPVCLSVNQALEQWADGGSIVRQPAPNLTEDCTFNARKGSRAIKAMVFPDYGGDSDVVVQLSATGSTAHSWGRPFRGSSRGGNGITTDWSRPPSSAAQPPIRYAAIGSVTNE